MNFLQICPKVPYPPLDGGCIAINNLTQGLMKAGHRVKVLALSTPKYPAARALKDKQYWIDTSIETVFTDTSVNPVAAIANLFSRRSYNIERFYSKPFEQKIVDTLTREAFDIILFESIYTASYLEEARRASAAITVLRTHNIEHEIWQGTRDLEKQFLKRAYFSVLSERLKKYETTMCRLFDGILPITDADGEKLRKIGCASPMETIPFGIDIEKVSSSLIPEYPSVFHLGAMNWRPNQDAIAWLLKEVWGEVVARFPEVNLYLAGRSMPDWLMKHRHPNVAVVGEVENAYDFMASKSIMVVPLFSGSGMRIKIVEGMALGKTIITTTLGSEGIDCQHGKNILIANNPKEFIERISDMLSDRPQCERIGREAANLVKSRFDNDFIVDKMSTFCKCLCRQSSSK